MKIVKKKKLPKPERLKVLRNDLNKRCQSCGNETSHKKYNHVFLCFMCCYMSKDGLSRFEGTLINMDKDYGRN